MAVADPGFPRGRAPTPGGVPTSYLTNVSRKLHENKDILVQGASLRSATELKLASLSPIGTLNQISLFEIVHYSLKW